MKDFRCLIKFDLFSHANANARVLHFSILRNKKWHIFFVKKHKIETEGKIRKRLKLSMAW